MSLTEPEVPGTIDAVPVRHPGRVVAVIITLVVTAMLVHQLFVNPAFDWPFTFEAMTQQPVIDGYIKGTLLVTVAAMVFGVLLGILLAVMRMSPNFVLRWIAGVYIWFFRGMPRYVLLAILGGAGAFFAGGLIVIGVPYDEQILSLLGIHGTLRIGTIDANVLFSSYAGAVLGLGLSEAAYMAEIARSGILSVDKGQTEAALALGMSRSQTMRRIVLPQAMRVIVPPTGNETIAMFKDTSLLSALPLAGEMYFQLHSIGTAYYKLVPVLIAATIYYLATATVMGIGQSWLERHFGRGYANGTTPTRGQAKAASATSGETPLMFPGSDH
ncbi:MAG: ABC transporter permease [Actinobacteria bacterium HGW-Actinobacteria-2]|nr:MAG: ABC transporter permease [Actinobacteria bacterium HGW-Actinobacteria-2]